MRAETGPMQFGDDWRGIFIRGDVTLMGHVPHLAAAIADIQALPQDGMRPYTVAVLRGLLALLQEADHHGSTEDLQILKPFDECVKFGGTMTRKAALEMEWAQIAEEAIQKAEAVECSLRAFATGLWEIETTIRERRVQAAAEASLVERTAQGDPDDDAG